MKKFEKKFIDTVIDTGKMLPKEIIGHPPGVLLRSLRKRLRMTQLQLAKRVGLPQSYIAKIESKSANPTLDTLEKIFRGLGCSPTILLIPEIKPDDLLEQQAFAAAQKNIRYVAGTMALEEQLPSKSSLREMLEEEKKRLLESKTTKIWD